ncbi:uncharacterized protein LOC131888352 [Tigriopus californicus]|uniref:uncharacterized protein LOC131888352 n=1 Tax=Tigriopus californicus TaxID=6832 RepID=UPI0027D9D6F9|nr:uncharacterized protein LOC131888352 [Tigriopus californicus]|eukprot:TCALIF_10255-PA protein Name:"Similar to Morn1 MORN repeat-containing protein 1 (Rattus norvegicus)" AED:0.00 eAED:0.00 QI:71/1/1/1/0.6/0.5/6/253/320
MVDKHCIVVPTVLWIMSGCSFHFGVEAQRRPISKNGAEKFGTLADFNLVDNGLYSGDTRRGLPHGDGLLVFFTTDREKRYNYSGEWFNGRRQGHGVLNFRDGTVYEGHFDKNQPNGRGKISYYNGDEFQGFFIQGKRDGQGMLTFNTGARREGEWKKDLLNGFVFYHPSQAPNRLGPVEIERWENGKRKPDGATERAIAQDDRNQSQRRIMNETRQTNFTFEVPSAFARGGSRIVLGNAEKLNLVSNSGSPSLVATDPDPLNGTEEFHFRTPRNGTGIHGQSRSGCRSRRQDRTLLKEIYDWVQGSVSPGLGDKDEEDEC